MIILGYEKMQKALEDYIQAINTERIERQESEGKSLADIVRQDSSVLSDTTYMRLVEELLTKARRTNQRKIRYFNNIRGEDYRMEKI